MKTDPLDDLRRWELSQPALIVALVSALNSRGIITDEEHAALSSSMIEGWSPACDALLRHHGYKGDPICTCGGYSRTRGGVYGLYNPELVSHDDAEAHVKKIGDTPE